MNFFYYPATGGFYESAIHGDIPEGALPVTEETHAFLLAEQATGKKIEPGPGGAPIAVTQAPSLAQLQAAAIAAVKKEAERRALAVASLFQQSNDNADMARAAMQLAVDGSTTIDTAAALARRAQIDAIRTASNTLEAHVMTLDAAGLAAFTAADNAHWD